MLLYSFELSFGCRGLEIVWCVAPFFPLPLDPPSLSERTSELFEPFLLEKVLLGALF